MSGELVFNAIGCNACHVAQWTTGSTGGLESAIAGKTIRPYSDFLVHDMGLLADGVGGRAGERAPRAAAEAGQPAISTANVRWRARGDGPVFTKFPGGHLKIQRVDYEMWLANLQRVA
jgi:hypothetical protein